MLLAPGLRASDAPALRLEAIGTTLRVVTPSGQVVEGAQLTGAVLTASVGGTSFA